MILQCSHPCGRKGRQIRRLFCHDRNGKRVAKFNCPKEFKPQRKRKCNQRRCGPLTCLEAKKKFKTIKDGEYILLIGGRNMTIYCHGMTTDEPTEYLTLPSGERENYAEIYDKKSVFYFLHIVNYIVKEFLELEIIYKSSHSYRLKNLDTCPFNGQRNDNSILVEDIDRISGRTMFKRVRIDVARLIIIGKISEIYLINFTQYKCDQNYQNIIDFYCSFLQLTIIHFHGPKGQNVLSMEELEIVIVLKIVPKDVSVSI